MKAWFQIKLVCLFVATGCLFSEDGQMDFRKFDEISWASIQTAQTTDDDLEAIQIAKGCITVYAFMKENELQQIAISVIERSFLGFRFQITSKQDEVIKSLGEAVIDLRPGSVYIIDCKIKTSEKAGNLIISKIAGIVK